MEINRYSSGKDIPEMTKDIQVTEQILVKNENDIDSVEKNRIKNLPQMRIYESIMPLPQTNPPS